MMQNKNLAALAAVLALGAASAQATGGTATPAGTTITNTAYVTYEDPNNPGNNVPNVPSNPVTTTVNAVPNFTITPNNTDSADNQETPGQEQAGKRPGEEVVFPYTVTNTGNTPVVVQLTTKDRAETDVQNVKYYLRNPNGSRGAELVDTNGDGLVEVPQLPQNGVQQIFQVYTIPNNATNTQVFGADPVGTGVYNPDVSTVTTTVDLATGTDVGITDSNNWNRATLTTPNLVTRPPKIPDPNDPADPTPPTPGDPGKPVSPRPGNPITPTPVVPSTPTDPVNPNDPNHPGIVTPPPSDPGTPVKPGDNPGNGIPNNPVDPNDNPNDPGNNTPGVPGYRDPNPIVPGTPTNIEVRGDRQIAYPPADTDNNPDHVTFINQVTNRGTLPDTVTLMPPTDLPNGVTVQILVPDGNGNYVPGNQVTVPANGTVDYRVVVTYPDVDNSPTKRDPINVVIGVDSGNDGDNTPDDYTVDTVMPPAMQFGDSTPALGAVPTPAPSVTVVPSPTATADFPMDVANTGAYADTYTLEGTVPTLPGAVVTYYYNGQPLPRLNGSDPVTGTGPQVSPVVPAGQEIKVTAHVTNIPGGTAPGDYPVSQTAKSQYSGITLTDTNDIVHIGVNGQVAVGKFVQGGAGLTSITRDGVTISAPVGYATTSNNADGSNPSTALSPVVKPGDVINYAIVARSGYNAPVNNFYLCDTVPANTTFAGAVVPGGSLFRVNGGAWNVFEGAAIDSYSAGTQVCFAPAGANNQPGTLPAGSTYTVEFKARVN